MTQLGTAARPLRVAVVGAGPAGPYAAQALLDRPDLVVTADVLNRFPTPFGLVRDGVAPDHQSIKAVTRVLERTLADPRVRFCSNVTYGPRRSGSSATGWSSTPTAGSGPRARAGSRSSRPAWCCARSATGRCRSRGCRDDHRDPEMLEVVHRAR